MNFTKKDYIEDNEESYFVFVKDGRSPRHTHHSLESAELEAIRLTAEINKATFVCKKITKFYCKKQKQ